ncbi:MAG: amino acid-binding ACT [Gemmataceae bacterium]|nr:amino acid-binding ACT [Gemmataceae bacterium]
MSFKWDRVHVWSVDIKDETGAASSKLAALAQAGANLEFIDTQRVPSNPGSGTLTVAPITGPAQHKAARAVGLHEAETPILHRFEGDNQAGLAHRVTKAWELANISLHGLTMAVLGSKFVGYVSFDTADDANRAAQILADVGSST